MVITSDEIVNIPTLCTTLPPTLCTPEALNICCRLQPELNKCLQSLLFKVKAERCTLTTGNNYPLCSPKKSWSHVWVSASNCNTSVSASNCNTSVLHETLLSLWCALWGLISSLSLSILLNIHLTFLMMLAETARLKSHCLLWSSSRITILILGTTTVRAISCCWFLFPREYGKTSSSLVKPDLTSQGSAGFLLNGRLMLWSLAPGQDTVHHVSTIHPSVSVWILDKAKAYIENAVLMHERVLQLEK